MNQDTQKMIDYLASRTGKSGYELRSEKIALSKLLLSDLKRQYETAVANDAVYHGDIDGDFDY